MTRPVVTLKQRTTAQGFPFTEVFVAYAGQRFYSRSWHVVPDSPHMRAREAQSFLERLRRYPSRVAVDAVYGETMQRVDQAMSETDDLIAFAKTGAPPAIERPIHGGYPGTEQPAKRANPFRIVGGNDAA